MTMVGAVEWSEASALISGLSSLDLQPAKLVW